MSATGRDRRYMNVLFDIDKLAILVANLRQITDIITNVFNNNGVPVHLFEARAEFCSLINSTAEGRRRCYDCDIKNIKICEETQRDQYYHCHANISEMIVPVYDNVGLIAYIIFGQFLDREPTEELWERTLAMVDWYTGDINELKNAFFKLKYFEREKVRSYVQILDVMIKYVIQEGLIRSAEYSDIQKLEKYIDDHYSESITLSKASAELTMGMTKICNLSKEVSGGNTFTWLVNNCRISRAKQLLLQGDDPIYNIATKVGFNDYNYFTRVFHKFTGMTPKEYRTNSLSDQKIVIP